MHVEHVEHVHAPACVTCVACIARGTMAVGTKGARMAVAGARQPRAPFMHEADPFALLHRKPISATKFGLPSTVAAGQMIRPDDMNDVDD